MIIIELFARGAAPRHQPTGPTNPIRIDTSWPHHTPQIRLACSLPLDQPRQRTPRYRPPAPNRPATYRARRDPPLIRRPLQPSTTRCVGSIQIRQLARRTQIPIAPWHRLTSLKRFPPLEAFGRRPPNTPRRSSSGWHLKPCTNPDNSSKLPGRIIEVSPIKLSASFPASFCVCPSQAGLPCGVGSKADFRV